MKEKELKQRGFKVGTVEELLQLTPEEIVLMEKKLQELYPNLDFSKDPTEELLHGKYKEEMEAVIKGIVDDD